MDIASVAHAAMMVSANTGQDLNMLIFKQAAVQDQAVLALVTQAAQTPAIPAASASHLGANVDLTA